MIVATAQVSRFRMEAGSPLPVSHRPKPDGDRKLWAQARWQAKSGCSRATPSAERPTAESSRRRAYDLARASCPLLDVTFEAFSSHLNSLGYERSLPCQLESLYLCLACSLGRDDAYHLVERRHLSALRTFLSGFDAREDVVDELLQQVRYRLLVGPNAKIRGYRGEGPLDAWLRRIARSVAVDFLRSRAAQQRRLVRCSRELMCLEATHGQPPEPPDECLHGECSRRRLEAALRRALDTLSTEQRQVLYQYYVSELTIDQLGVVYRCDRSTAARRVVGVVRAIRRRLRQELPHETITSVEWRPASWWRFEIGALLPDTSRGASAGGCFAVNETTGGVDG
jgi:RNA polymerase sigma-70 factor